MTYKTLIIIIFALLKSVVYSQPKILNFSTQTIGGHILSLNTNITMTSSNPTFGGELAIEFPSWNQYPW